MSEREVYSLQTLLDDENLKNINLVTSKEDLVYNSIVIDFVASLNSSNHTDDYYLKYAEVTPDDYNRQWSAHFLIKVQYNETGGYSSAYNNNATVLENLSGIYEFEIWGSKTASPNYRCTNSITNTSYRGIYSNVVKRSKSADFPHCIGFRMRSAYDLRYGRTITIYLIEHVGCKVVFNEERLSYANFYDPSPAQHPVYNSNNYEVVAEYNGYTNGTFGTGISSSNTYDRLYFSNDILAGNTIGRYKLLLEDFEGKVCPLVYDVGSSAAVVNAPVETRKLKLNGLMLYYNTTTTVDAGATVKNMYSSIPCDIRYTFNMTFANTTVYTPGINFEPQKPVYLKGTLTNDGYWQLGSGNASDYLGYWSQELPTSDDGFIYVYVGYMYSVYQMRLAVHHPIYIFKDGSLQLWTSYAKRAGIASDAELLEGQGGQFYLDYNNLNNKPFIPNPVDYYWANIKVSGSSSEATQPTFKSATIKDGTSNARFQIGANGCVEVVFT